MYNQITIWKIEIEGLTLGISVDLEGNIKPYLSKFFTLSELMSKKSRFALELSRFLRE